MLVPTLAVTFTRAKKYKRAVGKRNNMIINITAQLVPETRNAFISNV